MYEILFKKLGRIEYKEKPMPVRAWVEAAR